MLRRKDGTDTFRPWLLSVLAHGGAEPPDEMHNFCGIRLIREELIFTTSASGARILEASKPEGNDDFPELLAGLSPVTHKLFCMSIA